MFNNVNHITHYEQTTLIFPTTVYLGSTLIIYLAF